MPLKARTLRQMMNDVMRQGIDLYAPDSIERLRAFGPWSGELGAEEERQALEALRALQGLAVEQAPETRAQAVATARSSTGLPRIDGALARIFERCSKNLLVMSLTYSVEMMERIEAVARRGSAVTLVGNEDDERFRHMIAFWRVPQNPPVGLVAKDVGKMHIKAAIADRKAGYLGSGNFTKGGVMNNLELGITFEGPLAEQVWRFVESQRRSGHLVEFP